MAVQCASFTTGIMPNALDRLTPADIQRGLPVHVFTFQTGDVALTGTQVPAQLVKRFTFGVYFGGDDWAPLN